MYSRTAKTFLLKTISLNQLTKLPKEWPWFISKGYQLHRNLLLPPQLPTFLPVRLVCPGIPRISSFLFQSSHILTSHEAEISPSKGQTQQVSNVHVSLRAPIHVDCVTRGNSL